MAKIKVDKEEVKKAILAANAMKTGICEVLDISRPTLDRYLKDKELQEFFDFTRIKQIDRAEYRLMEAIEKGEAWAIQLLLKDSKRGRERGYGNAVDVTSGGEKLTQIGLNTVDYRSDITKTEE